MLVQRQVGRVDEEHLPDLGVEWVHTECDDRRALILLGHRHLQLDAVGVFDQCDQLLDLLVGEERPFRSRWGH